MLLRQRSFIEQSLCIVSLILLHENIPRVQALEQLNDCIELTLHFNIGDAFEALLHFIIEVRSDIRRAKALLVQKLQKRPIASYLEQHLALEAVLDHLRELEVKLEQFLCEQERVFQVLLAEDDLTAAQLDVGLHVFDDLGKRVLVVAEHIVDQLKLVELLLLEEFVDAKILPHNRLSHVRHQLFDYEYLHLVLGRGLVPVI